MIAYLSLGANMYKPRHQVQKAVQLLSADPKIRVLRKSSLVRTEAYGNEDQPDFRNQVVEIETRYNPQDLLQKLQSLENEMGRIRKEKWGPRVIDLDILFYEDLVLDSKALTLPHKDLHNRRFILELLEELVPDMVHPNLHKSISQLKQELEEREGSQ
ncbi:MAG: 2-amino-4-hydroxy-6-hydroxymethyldihydropteridine diphosphokinase [Candidatus Syntrophosphaera sp.]|nr:2-amino-4-hydroxy-6-hydroxymethyldihydropteridine diphosphokinase [Candidatus Syntrophosphaera sp.]